MVQKRFSRRELDQGKRNRKYRSYFQNFQLIEYSTGDMQSLSLINQSKDSHSRIDFAYLSDFSVSPGHVSQSGEGTVIFVGYGLKDEEKAYNDFAGVKVEGKIILRVKGYPGHMDENSTSFKKFRPENRWQEYRMNREKNEIAGKLGAVAILEVDLESDDMMAWSGNLPFRFNTAMYEGDERPDSYYDSRMMLPGDEMEQTPPVFSISRRMAAKIMEGSELSLDQFETEAAANPTPASKELKNKQISFQTTVDSKMINARNVVGVIKGKDTTEMIVVGAHYDHLGKHSGFIWNGADDNASGTVGVMTIARACMATGEKPEKTIVFAAWTGEEKGLWG
jgi:hypothetical protein